jgi:biotin carboxylase
MTRDVFVLGCDEFNLDQLRAVRDARDCRFHPLSTYDEAMGAEPLGSERLLAQARARLDAHEGGVDAILGWWDFPVSTLLPILCREYGVPGPTLEATLRCENKYWSRLEQRRCVPEHAPRVQPFDPFQDDAFDRIELPLPFWIKPVKSVGSYLGFRIESRDDFEDAIAKIREGIGELGDRFDEVLRYAELPPEIEEVDGRHCVAESIISRGRQATLEGYVHRGEVHVYGVVGTIREGRHRSSFSRYQYPFELPRRVRRAMAEVAARFLRHVGFDGSPFNAEFFWNRDDDSVHLLEVNTRISKSHAPLFDMVDGESHHAVNLRCALGLEPRPPRRQGRFRVAAKFMPRRRRDAVVTRVPTEDDVARVQRAFPGTLIELHVREGMRLCELRGQESYSYMLAEIHMGASNEKELRAHYRDALAMLDFRFADVR